MAKALLEYETLTGDEIEGLMNGQSIDRSTPPDDEPSGNAPSSSAVPNSNDKDMPGGMEPEPQGS